MNELQAGVEPAFTVFPQPAIFFQPRKATLDHPAFRHDLEGMQLTSLGNLHRDVLSQRLSHALREGLTRVAAVAQHT